MELRSHSSSGSLESIALALLQYLDQTEADYINSLYLILATVCPTNKLKPFIRELIQLCSMPYLSCFYNYKTFSFPQPGKNDVLRVWVSLRLPNVRGFSYLPVKANNFPQLLRSENAYLQYISIYNYRPDDDPETIYLFKRPLHRIRVLAKFFKVRKSLAAQK